MFEFVAKHKRLLQLVLLLVIVPPFALWGVDSYQNMLTAGATDVADVDGLKITEKEFSDALRQQQDRLRAMLGGKIDPSFLDTPKMRREILDGMISQRLVTQHAISSKFYVSDEQLREVIASIPAFQDGGKFSKTRYEAALTAEGFSPATFENSLQPARSSVRSVSSS
jgi:peptidyl-prolyl cis-trans isomerase D